jgi:hypothetical protein
MRIRRLGALVALVFVAAACRRSETAVSVAPAAALDLALAPPALAASLRHAGGGHFHATTMFRVEIAGRTGTDDAGRPVAPSAVTTTTDLWMDKLGNFRIAENNDQDGGREIVRVGSEVAVALRYGKLVRRAAQDAESSRFLAEALGSPWAAWEMVRRQVEVEGGGQDASRFKLGKRLASLPPAFAPMEGLRKWRGSVLVKTLEGQATLAAGGKLPLAFACKATYQAVRDEQPITGELAVTATLEEVGKVADLAMPEADTLHVRQRTVLEERALLGGLGAGAPSAAPANKAAP